jgi:hypothetical protein
MVKCLKIDKINEVADVEIHKNELKNIVQSVNYMTDKVKKELLENLPSSLTMPYAFDKVSIKLA